MKTIIKLELFGENIREEFKIFNSIMDQMPKKYQDHYIPPPSSWVAEIAGTSDKWKYERKFLKGKRDFSKANGAGSRGIFIEFILETGKIYQIQSAVSWKKHEKYFAKVSDDGDIIKLTESEVETWLKNQLV